MGLLLLIVGVVLFGAFVASLGGKRSSRRPAVLDAPAEDERPLDQLEQLQRHGTSDDAARLIAEGRGDELKGLGWHDPEGRI